MKIFVTGATGVLGRRLLPKLVNQAHSVTAVARSKDKEDWIRSVGANPISVDLFDPNAVINAVQEHSVVINLATHIPQTLKEMSDPKIWEINDRIRREVSKNLATAAKKTGAHKIIQESIALPYQDHGSEWIDETYPLKPTSVMRSAQVAEQNVLNSGVDAVVLRFSYFYGPDSHHSQEFIKLARYGVSMYLGPRDAYITMIHLDDASDAIVYALNAPAGIYNIAEDQPLTRKDATKALANSLDKHLIFRLPGFFVPASTENGDMMRRSQRISNRKFKEATGWRPHYPSEYEGWRAIVSALQSSGNGSR
jgi:nucleoside-diphosphate-sugar epimerase